jgi:hypothetical protein
MHFEAITPDMRILRVVNEVQNLVNHLFYVNNYPKRLINHTKRVVN